MEQRKHGRYPVEYSGSFSGDGISATGVIFDLSSAGCRARSEVTVGKGEFVGVLIDAPRYETPQQVALAVVHWSHDQECGMEFIKMAPNDQQRLRDLIRATESARALRTEHVDEGINSEGQSFSRLLWFCIPDGWEQRNSPSLGANG